MTARPAAARPPPLGPGRQRRHGGIGQGRVRPGRHLLQQGRRLANGEQQLGPAQLSQLSTRAQPRQRQRRVTTASEHHAYPRRPVLQEEPERFVHRLRADHVIVIEHQQRAVRIRPGGQFVDQGCHQRFERRRSGRAEQRGNPFANCRTCPLKRSHHVAPEPGRVVIPCVQRQPRHRLLTAPRPVGQQDRLAVSGRRAHQDQPLGQAFIEPLRQPRARYEPRPWPGQVQLGGQQDISLGGHLR